jgi:hypothetical protein
MLDPTSGRWRDLITVHSSGLDPRLPLTRSAKCHANLSLDAIMSQVGDIEILSKIVDKEVGRVGQRVLPWQWRSRLGQWGRFQLHVNLNRMSCPMPDLQPLNLELAYDILRCVDEIG